MKPGWRNLLVIFTALLMSAPGLAAVENRFLLIVEATADSARNTQATRDAVADLLVKGFNGIAKPGDTIGVWVAGERLDTTFPMLVWQPTAARAYAVQADAFVSKRPWVGRWNVTNALPAIKAVAADSTALTVALVSAPRTRLTGMPFSENVSDIQDNAAADLERTRLPFVTFLTVREREFTAAAVNSGMGPWTIPNPPLPKPVVAVTPAVKPVSKPLVAAKSIVGNATKIELSSNPPARLPEATPTPVVVDAKPPEAIAPAPKAPPLPSPAVTNAISQTSPPIVNENAARPKAPEPKPVAIVPPVKPEPAEAVAVVEAKRKITAPPSSAPVAVTKAPEPTAPMVAEAIKNPEPHPLRATRPEPAHALVTPPAVASVANTANSGNGFLFAGIGVALAVVVLGWLTLRRPKASQSSLITQSLKLK